MRRVGNKKSSHKNDCFRSSAFVGIGVPTNFSNDSSTNHIIKGCCIP